MIISDRQKRLEPHDERYSTYAATDKSVFRPHAPHGTVHRTRSLMASPGMLTHDMDDERNELCVQVTCRAGPPKQFMHDGQLVCMLLAACLSCCAA